MLKAKSNLSRLVEAVESGLEQEIIIARNGKPAAKLVPIGSPSGRGPRIGVANVIVRTDHGLEVGAEPRSAGGRALSVLPPHHVVLARREQLLSDLPEAFALLRKKYAANYPSFISFITGPSRTGDIERILVLGAHGPRKLTILCV